MTRGIYPRKRCVSGIVALFLAVLCHGVVMAKASPVLPDTSGPDISFAQINVQRPLDLSLSGGSVGFVWGGPSTGPHVPGSTYYPMSRDLDRSHDPAWWQAHMRDGLAYQCDAASPAGFYSYAWGAFTAIDIANPQVRQYVFNTFLAPAITRTNPVIAVDNVSPRNVDGRCGAFRHGHWVTMYSGAKRDPAFARDVVDWIGWLRAHVHAAGGLLALNAKVDKSDLDRTRQIIAQGDIWLDEAAYTRDCKGRVAMPMWGVKFALAQWAAPRMGWVDLEKSCASPATIDDDEAQWVVGNFLLSKGAQSYLAVVHDGDPPAGMRYPASLNPPVGRPLGAAYPLGGGVMARRFTHGLVLVNPSPGAFLSFPVPPGQWRRMDGHPLGDAVHLRPTSALILLGAADRSGTPALR